MRAKFPATIHLLFLRERQILLSRRFNTGFRDGEYSVPAGHLDGAETVTQAGQREAFEEVGVRIEEEDMVFSSVMHRMEGEERIDFFVEIKKWQGEPFNAEPDKCDELCWATIGDLPENIIPYVARAIDNHFNKNQFDEFGFK